jgi:hypothetical protein
VGVGVGGGGGLAFNNKGLVAKNMSYLFKKFPNLRWREGERRGYVIIVMQNGN